MTTALDNIAYQCNRNPLWAKIYGHCSTAGGGEGKEVAAGVANARWKLAYSKYKMAETGKSAIQRDLRVQAGDSRLPTPSDPSPVAGVPGKAEQRGKPRARGRELPSQVVCHGSVNAIWQWFNSWQNVCLTACALTMHIGHCFWPCWLWAGLVGVAIQRSQCGMCGWGGERHVLRSMCHVHAPPSIHTIGMGRATATNEGQSKLSQTRSCSKPHSETETKLKLKAER